MTLRATIAIASLGVAAALWRAGAPAPAPASSPARAPTTAMVPRAPTPIQPTAVAAPSASAPRYVMANVARVEAAVRDARRHGKDEQEVYRLRLASLPAAQVEAISRMEAAEASWRQRLEALQSACAANIGCEDARASFSREELARTTAYAAPRLRQ